MKCKWRKCSIKKESQVSNLVSSESRELGVLVLRDFKMSLCKSDIASMETFSKTYHYQHRKGNIFCLTYSSAVLNLPNEVHFDVLNHIVDTIKHNIILLLYYQYKFSTAINCNVNIQYERYLISDTKEIMTHRLRAIILADMKTAIKCLSGK